MPKALPADLPACLGVVIVTYNAADVILACLETLLASSDVTLRIVVVDNASTDGTPDLIADWAAGSLAPHLADLPFAAGARAKPVTVHADLAACTDWRQHAVSLISAPINLGFASGVNRGLAVLAELPQIERFWVLNPDCVVPPSTAAAFARYTPPEGSFALMGGRVLYLDNPTMIQIDGGTIARWSGITGNLGLFGTHSETPAADPAQMDFIAGASMVASRAFYEAAGPMREDYFLYYEEVDWALRRGRLPLAYCPGALIYHHGGSAIGSAIHNRPATPFALYFKHRARMIFLRRFYPASRLTAHVWSLAKAGQFLLRGWHREARALLAGAFGRPPPPHLRRGLSAATLHHILGEKPLPAKDGYHAG